MGDTTGIAWTNATWNPVTGCSHVSAGCEHCYAETLSLRRGWSKRPWTAPNVAENVILHPARLEQPLGWRRPRRVFVNSMSDLFHPHIPDAFIAKVFAVMAVARRHQFQILTKRPEIMWSVLEDEDFQEQVDVEVREIAVARGWICADEVEAWPLLNVWLGASIEQDRWTNRVVALRNTDAAVRFVSLEPLLEPLPSLDLTGVDWVIVGGESGHAPDERSLVEEACCPSCGSPRPDAIALSCGYCEAYPEVRKGLRVKPWALAEVRRLRDLAHDAGAAYFLKQWGGATPKSGGNLLDGRTWEEFPAGVPV